MCTIVFTAALFIVNHWKWHKDPTTGEQIRHISLQHTPQLRGTFHILLQWGEWILEHFSEWKKTYTKYNLQLCETLKQAKLIASFKGSSQQLPSGDEDGGWLYTKRHEFTFMYKANVLHLDRIWGYMGYSFLKFHRLVFVIYTFHSV